tara:strand:+ start:2693 stop:3400 length:708 start_codon:yes stop_codon:yes gene_type:complete
MDEDYAFKIILVGNTGTGKTSILYNFLNERINPIDISPTIGIDFGTKRINMDNKMIKLNLWDTAGLEKYSSITRSYFRNIAGAIIVFDLTNLTSFMKIKNWYDEIRENSHNKDIQFILVGNKSDLENRIVVNDKEIEELAYRLNIDYVRTSVIKNHNINFIFEKISLKILNSCKHINRLQLIRKNSKNSYTEKCGIRYNHKTIDSLEFSKPNDNNDDDNHQDDSENKTCGFCIIS